MQASDVMTSNVIAARRDSPVAEIAQLLLQHRISAVPVVDSKGSVLGIVSEGDLMRRSESETATRHSWWLETFLSKTEKAKEFIKTHGQRAEDVMSVNVVVATEDMALNEVAKLLEAHQIKRVPIVRDGHLVGIISRANLLHGLATMAGHVPMAVSADDRTARESLMQTLGGEVGLNTAMINVVVSGGVVTLWGIVDSEAEKKAAQIAAEETPGVKSVENNLKQLPTWVWAT